MDNYEKLVERISKSSSLPIEEIERKIEAKKAKLSGLISKEGAAQIVAAELGVNFDQEKLKLSELVEGMKRVNVIGKIIKINPIKEFNKNGRTGKVASLTLADESGNIRVVLWDTNHINLIESNKIGEKNVVEISNANIRNGELHLASFSDIKDSKEKIDNVVVDSTVKERKLSEAKIGENFKTRATIVKIFDPKHFEVCSECGKKAEDSRCKTHGQIVPARRVLLTCILDDGTETIKATLFGEQISKLGLTEEQISSPEEYQKQKSDILGEEKNFTGYIKNNDAFQTKEFNILEVSSVYTAELVKELENKIKTAAPMQ